MTPARRPAAPPFRGRQGEALSNDARILDAARQVLFDDPRASMALIAERAQVGVASLYRRFASKDELLEQLCLTAMEAITKATDDALADLDADPWDAFVAYLWSALQAGAGSLTPLAGTFRAGERLNAAAARMHASGVELLSRAQSRGAVREDITAEDVTRIFEMLYGIYVGDHTRRAALRHRYLQLLTPALRAPAAAPLTEPPPTLAETIAAWNRAP